MTEIATEVFHSVLSPPFMLHIHQEKELLQSVPHIQTHVHTHREIRRIYISPFAIFRAPFSCSSVWNKVISCWLSVWIRVGSEDDLYCFLFNCVFWQSQRQHRFRCPPIPNLAMRKERFARQFDYSYLSSAVLFLKLLPLLKIKTVD